MQNPLSIQIEGKIEPRLVAVRLNVWDDLRKWQLVFETSPSEEPHYLIAVPQFGIDVVAQSQEISMRLSVLADARQANTTLRRYGCNSESRDMFGPLTSRSAVGQFDKGEHGQRRPIRSEMEQIGRSQQYAEQRQAKRLACVSPSIERIVPTRIGQVTPAVAFAYKGHCVGQSEVVD